MKNLYTLLILSLLLSASHLYSQNDTLYVYKAGIIINKQSIKTVDVDSITFYKPSPVITEQSPVQKNLTNMLKGLGLMSVGSASKTTAKMSSQKGDITAMSYFDKSAQENYSFKINEEESTKDKMVYYGTQTATYNGAKTDWRYTLSASGDKTIMKKEVELNGEYVSHRTYELTQNPDKTVTEKEVKSDGSKSLVCTFKPNSLTSLIRVSDIGRESLLDNFLIIQK